MKRYLYALLISTSMVSPALADQTSGGSSSVTVNVSGPSQSPVSDQSYSYSQSNQTVNNNPVNINSAQGGHGGSSYSNATGGNATGGKATAASVSSGTASASTGSSSASTGPVAVTTGPVSNTANPSANTGPVNTTVENTYRAAASTAYAPSLVANDCMGTISFGLSFVGTGGSGGYTFHNKKCEHMEDVNMAVTLGMKKTAIIMMEYPDMSFEKAALIAGEYIGPATIIPAK